MTFRKKIKNILNHIPLWMQLALFTTALTFTVLFHLIYADYQRNSQVIADTQTDTSCRLLAMEIQNLEKYVHELALFCIQSCYDHTFTNIVEKDSPILPGETTYLKNQLRAYFYSRNDIKTYDLYLMNHGKCFSRTQSGVRTNPFTQNQSWIPTIIRNVRQALIFMQSFPHRKKMLCFFIPIRFCELKQSNRSLS